MHAGPRRDHASITIDCLPGSVLPGELTEAGYRVEEIGEGERILPTSLVESFVIGLDGRREPVTEGFNEGGADRDACRDCAGRVLLLQNGLNRSPPLTQHPPEKPLNALPC